MNLLKRLLFAAALLVLGGWLWTGFLPSPDRVIRKRLAEVAKSASFNRNEGPLARILNVKKLGECCSADVEIVFDVPGQGQHTLTGRDEVNQAALGTRNHLTALTVEFLDMNVALAADKQSAVVDLTATAKVPGDKDFMVQEMKFTLKKINGEWLITRVETVKTLS